MLLTTPVTSGYTQNPISVYYCYSSQGTLSRCIAEVSIGCRAEYCVAAWLCSEHMLVLVGRPVAPPFDTDSCCVFPQKRCCHSACV